MNNRATVIVDTCESPEDIDVRRAKEAKERAEERLRQKQSIQEYYRSKASLARAVETTESQQPRQTDRLLKSSSKRQPFWLSCFASGWYNRKSE